LKLKRALGLFNERRKGRGKTYEYTLPHDLSELSKVSPELSRSG
jgi:hypothetical protein